MLSAVSKLVFVLAVAFAALVPLSTIADAQGIHSRCAKARDPVRCTCGRENGALRRFVPGRGWVLMYREAGQAVNERFVACMRRRGRA
jgi:hypothetical protein